MTTPDYDFDLLRTFTRQTVDALPAELTCTTLDVPLTAYGAGPVVAFTSPSFPGLAVTTCAVDPRRNGVVGWRVTHLRTGKWVPTVDLSRRLDEVLAFAVALGRLADWTTVTAENVKETVLPLVGAMQEALVAVRDVLGEYSCEKCEPRGWLEEDAGR